MILLGIVYGTLTGNLSAVTEGVVDSAKEAVTLCISMSGITALWTGIMKIAEKAGLVERLAKGMSPVLRFLFPELKGEEKAKHYISLNFLSNLLGLNWASTSSGLMAFQELDRINGAGAEGQGGRAESGGMPGHRPDAKMKGSSGCQSDAIPGPKTASRAMCTFLIINVSSLQLIPVNMIAYRAQYGSANPAAIVGPAIAATAASTLAAVIFCRVMNRRVRL